MFIPYNTEAPLYHWPIGTLAMIGVNVLVSAACLTLFLNNEELHTWVYEAFSLSRGSGLRPWQWVTSNFMHAGPLHLLGNMVWLWSFGLVVEGKIGWKKFLAIFFSIGVVQCAIEQTLMLFSEPNSSMGASSIIFGLLVMALVWAPFEEMECFVLFFYRVYLFRMKVLGVVGISLIMNFMMLAFMDGSLGTAALHLMGAGLGLVPAIVMLRTKWVDCEGQDIFSWPDAASPPDPHADLEAEAQELLRAAREARAQGDTAASSSYSPSSAVSVSAGSVPLTPPPGATPLAPPPGSIPDNALTRVRAALAAGEVGQAAQIHLQCANTDPLWRLPEQELLAIISGLVQRRMWSESVTMMKQYLQHYFQRETQVRLKLAQIYIKVGKKPAQALQVLEPINENLIDPNEAGQVQLLRQHATAALAARKQT